VNPAREKRRFGLYVSLGKEIDTPTADKEKAEISIGRQRDQNEKKI